ncbi:MAG: hypothetical protein JNK67_24785 [Alphaproteobacteria bacterium]|nr:hypothetical protein [Alphaproteobacteria bacterium]
MIATRALAFCGLILLGIAPLRSLAQECERLPPAPGSTGYQQRRGSDRCEGLYVSPVSGGGIQLVSLTFGRIAYEPERDASLVVKAPESATSPLRLQGIGIPIGLYYRLDAALADGRPFQLPLGAVIKPNRIPPSDLGLIAFRDAGGGRRVYVPVHVGLDPAKLPPAAGATAVVRPDSDIQNLRWRLTASGAAPAEFRPVPAAEGPVPSGNRLEIALPKLDAASDATLELRYLDLSGRERTTRFQLSSR